MEEPSWIKYLTISLAATGTILGVINTVYLLFKDRVRVKVRIRKAFFVNVSPSQDGKDVLIIEVTNLGFIPVTISEAAFLLPDSSGRKIPLIGHNTPMGIQLPHRLEPRTSLSIYSSMQETEAIIQQDCKKGFVKTDCRRTFTAKRK